ERAARGERLHASVRVAIAEVVVLVVDVPDHQQLIAVVDELVDRAVRHRLRRERAFGARPEALGRVADLVRVHLLRAAVGLTEEECERGRLDAGGRARCTDAREERERGCGAADSLEDESSGDLHGYSSSVLRVRNAGLVTSATIRSRIDPPSAE